MPFWCHLKGHFVLKIGDESIRKMEFDHVMELLINSKRPLKILFKDPNREISMGAPMRAEDLEPGSLGKIASLLIIWVAGT